LISLWALNSYFPVPYNSTNCQQVIHKAAKWIKNAVFEFWLSFFSFVDLTLTGAEIFPLLKRASKTIFSDKYQIKALLLSARIFW
jgi:hypothetical protein